MFVALIVLSGLLALAFLASGGQKVLGSAQVEQTAHHLRVPLNGYKAIGALELAGAAGLIIGIFWPPLGIAAGIGLFLLVVGAVITHVRVGDGAKQYGTAVVFAVLLIGLVYLRLAV